MSYSPFNVLVTGVAGFIGSHVLVNLVQKYEQYNFIGIDKISYCSSEKNFEEITNASNFKFIQADITNLEMIDYIFKTYNIDTVLHFAAYSHVDQSFGNSIIFTKNNVLGTHVLLEASKKNNIKRFVHVSTDEVYGNQINEESNEKSILNPTNPYSATKAAAEHIVNSYYNSFKLPIIITRGNNVYGPKQYPEKVIPKFIYRLSMNLKCQIHGEGNQLRSFLHVNDVSKAFDLILHQGKIGETYNIGCENEHKIIDVAKTLIQKIHNCYNQEEHIEFIEDRCFNDQRYFISTEKLKKLGWEQKIDFSEGIKETIDWYLQNPKYWEDLENIII